MDAIDLDVTDLRHADGPRRRRAGPVDEPPARPVVIVPGRVDDAAADGFDALYRSEYPGMVRLAYLLVRDRELAVEVTHDAFARVLERWSKLERPGAYLRTAVVNASRDALRRRIFRRSRSHVAGLVEVTTPARDDYLADALAHLHPKRRAAIVLRYYLDLPEAEIAATLGVRPGTVKSLLHRGLADLREALSESTSDTSDPTSGSQP
jgi:RNA polymerase sigma factor (sigma-70 family)